MNLSFAIVSISVLSLFANASPEWNYTQCSGECRHIVFQSHIPMTVIALDEKEATAEFSANCKKWNSDSVSWIKTITSNQTTVKASGSCNYTVYSTDVITGNGFELTGAFSNTLNRCQNLTGGSFPIGLTVGSEKFSQLNCKPVDTPNNSDGDIVCKHLGVFSNISPPLYRGREDAELSVAMMQAKRGAARSCNDRRESTGNLFARCFESDIECKVLPF